MRHRIFIGSSNEDLTLANAIQRNLVQSGNTAKVWNQGIFSAGNVALDALLRALDNFDAAVFVFSPRDLLNIKGQAFEAVRDNVVFELGLKSEPAYIVAGIQSICRIMNDEKLTTLHVPLMGAGHGDIDDKSALLCLALALVTTPDIRHAEIVLFRKTPENEPDIDPALARKILAFAAQASRA